MTDGPSDILRGGLDFITTRSSGEIFLLFWFVIVFELPRYLAFLMVPFTANRTDDDRMSDTHRVTAIVAGHNEQDKIERCVRALREQSRPPDQVIVVSDGSTDRTAQKLRDLSRLGLVDMVHSPDLRGGKSAALNLAIRWATGDIVVSVDCDCSFDPDSIRNILAPFADPATAAVSGNIQPRNTGQSLATAFQAIEYLISISLSRQAQDFLGQVSCISGAFGAYRASVLRQAGGLDVGSGEDLDLTLRIRAMGGSVRFARDAVCFTDVPDTFEKLFRQRLRWEQDAIELRFRKHRANWNVFGRRFMSREVVHNAEFMFFNVIAGFALPVYLVWLAATFGAFALNILAAVFVALTLVDLACLLLAAHATPGVRTRDIILFLPGFGLFNSLIMRGFRCYAYGREWIFRASFQDAYVPAKVQKTRL